MPDLSNTKLMKLIETINQIVKDTNSYIPNKLECQYLAKKHQISSDFVYLLFVLIGNYKKEAMQHSLQTEALSIAHLGESGSYSSIAAKLFTQTLDLDLTTMACNSFKAVFDAVLCDKTTFAMLPVENTSSGSINEVYDLLCESDLQIQAEIFMPISHCFLAAKPIKINEIESIFAHSQPYQQCAPFLESLENVPVKMTSSSAEAMQLVSENSDKNWVAIGSEQGGQLYNLLAIKRNIAKQQQNITRFFLLSKAQASLPFSDNKEYKTTLVLSTKNQIGALYRILKIFNNYELNLTKLVSRPIIGKTWHEIFYIDIESSLNNQAMILALKELKEEAQSLTILGSYPKTILSID